eukprot:gnl/MRDRNA2_/MRDRNA2_34465_c0_seq1.p1 gnl/MRDRNA2_/MRDRNA2_34465_c0~~gnl/MRDRNA2_/MRDRNA2_34465_c0_seq1.p1  ORF type:complete len:306 (+),score=78.97 gnl/MRDRNA2_/MRDRNA2_34465_c0_seq1:202-1119(+)
MHCTATILMLNFSVQARGSHLQNNVNAQRVREEENELKLQGDTWASLALGWTVRSALLENSYPQNQHMSTWIKHAAKEAKTAAAAADVMAELAAKAGLELSESAWKKVAQAWDTAEQEDWIEAAKEQRWTDEASRSMEKALKATMTASQMTADQISAASPEGAAAWTRAAQEWKRTLTFKTEDHRESDDELHQEMEQEEIKNLLKRIEEVNANMTDNETQDMRNETEDMGRNGERHDGWGGDRSLELSMQTFESRLAAIFGFSTGGGAIITIIVLLCRLDFPTTLNEALLAAARDPCLDSRGWMV